MYLPQSVPRAKRRDLLAVKLRRIGGVVVERFARLQLDRELYLNRQEELSAVAEPSSDLLQPDRLPPRVDDLVICSPIELDTDGAILLRQDGRASWASFHGSRTADASSPWSSSAVSSSSF